MNKKIILIGIVIVILISRILYSQSDKGDIYKYSKNANSSPIYQPTFSVGANDGDSSKDYFIGCDDPYGPPKILSGGDKKDRKSMAFDCILRFYGQRDEYTNTGPKSVAWDFFESGAKASCNSKTSCPIRKGTQTYSPGTSTCSGKKHYVRWGGIHDGSNSLSKILTPIDQKKKIWNDIKFKIVMSIPGGAEAPLIPSNSGWVSFSDDMVNIADKALILSYPDTHDFSAWIDLSKYEVAFPISFQNCEPGKDDNHLIDSTNSYIVKFKMKFPYADWSNAIDLTNHTNGLNISNWELTLSERKFFIWDKIPPKIDITYPGKDCVMEATTGDPMYSNNIIRFKVTDDNPNQEIDTVTVTLSNGSFSKVYEYIEGDDANNTLKKPTIKRKTDINADDNFIAEFEVEFKPPPSGMKRDEILGKRDEYFITPHDSIEPIEGIINASVKYGVVDPNPTDPSCIVDGRVPNDAPPKFTINVTDNDPPGIEVGFILMKSDKAEIIAFKNDFANFPISKKACGVKVVELKEAKYCLDLDTFGTPIDFNLYPFGKGVPVLTKTLTSYPRPRKADDSPSDVTIDIRKHYPKKSGILVIEDERYYYIIKAVDNVNATRDIVVKLKQMAGCLTLNQKADTPIDIHDGVGWLLHRVFFTNPEEKTFIVLEATDASKNSLKLILPFKILNSILNWTSIDISN